MFQIFNILLKVIPTFLIKMEYRDISESEFARKVVVEKLDADWKKKKEVLIQKLFKSKSEIESENIRNKLKLLDKWYKNQIDSILNEVEVNEHNYDEKIIFEDKDVVIEEAINLNLETNIEKEEKNICRNRDCNDTDTCASQKKFKIGNSNTFKSDANNIIDKGDSNKIKKSKNSIFYLNDENKDKEEDNFDDNPKSRTSLSTPSIYIKKNEELNYDEFNISKNDVSSSITKNQNIKACCLDKHIKSNNLVPCNVTSNINFKVSFSGFHNKLLDDNNFSEFLANLKQSIDFYRKNVKTCNSKNQKFVNENEVFSNDIENTSCDESSSISSSKTKYKLDKKNEKEGHKLFKEIYYELFVDSIKINTLSVPLYLYNSLFDYQKKSLPWFFTLYNKKQGGVLADEMGLGKTIQVIAFIASMLVSGFIKNILLLAPSTVLNQWYTEFKKFFPFVRVLFLHSTHSKEIKKLIYQNLDVPSVYLISYEGFKTYSTALNFIKFDYIILDEGHKIKNKDSLISKKINDFEGENRIVISGTPIQNNLTELWAIFNFISPGQLGSHADFQTEYEDPIKKGSFGASKEAAEKAYRMSVVLRTIIEPNILRRLKTQVSYVKSLYNTENKKNIENISTDNNDQANIEFFNETSEYRNVETTSLKTDFCKKDFKNNDDYKKSVLQIKKKEVVDDEIKSLDVNALYKLPKMSDKVIFIKLTAEQEKLYSDFIESDYVFKILTGKINCLGGITILRKICNHPYLYYKNDIDPKMKEKKYLEKLKIPNFRENQKHENNNFKEKIDDDLNDSMHENTVLKCSGKMIKLAMLLDKWFKENKKVLIFTQMIGMLEILEEYFIDKGYSYLKMEGKTGLGTRTKNIESFNSDKDNIFIFLLTTRVGGLGLNLTGASRIVLYDPDWNPSTDTQAKERAWRFGQKNDVEIYRFITEGTIEEKIYRRQVFKGYLTNKILKNPSLSRFFEKDDINDLFTYKNDSKKIKKDEKISYKTENFDSFDKGEDALEFFNTDNVPKELKEKMKIFRGKEILDDEEMIDFIRMREEFEG